MDSIQEYATHLGRFWLNFNSLELIIRLYLMKRFSEPESGLANEVGENVPLSHLTNFDSFHSLAEKFRAEWPGPIPLDLQAAGALRDALAHGRVTTLTEVPMTVIKFGRPLKGDDSVKVEYKQVLTDQFLADHATAMRQAIDAIAAAMPARRPAST